MLSRCSKFASLPLAGKLFLGYRINKNFAIEGGYADLGQFAAASTGTIQFTHVIPPAPPTTVTIVTTENFTIKAKGVFVFPSEAGK